MGTSTTNGGTSGSGTPLVPSWLDDAGGQLNQPIIPGGLSPFAPSPVPPPAEANRYSAPRSAFSRFARSGGTNRSSLGRAVSGYVSRSSGGAKGAAQRMGSSRVTGSRLLGFLNDAVTRGVVEALKSLNLEGLAGRPINEIFKGLSDYMCPEGGSVDVGIARDAFFRTMVDLEKNGVTDLEDLTIDQVQTVFEMFTTHAIEDRIYNEIGTKAITLPADTAAIDNVQAQLHDFIGNGVVDALSGMKGRLQDLPQDKVLALVDEMYVKAYTVLESMGEAAKEQA